MWCDDKSIHIQARFDKVALREDKLVFISLVAFGQDMEAIRAALAAGLASPMWLKNVTLPKDGESTVPGSVSPSLTATSADLDLIVAFGLKNSLMSRVATSPSFIGGAMGGPRRFRSPVASPLRSIP